MIPTLITNSSIEQTTPFNSPRIISQLTASAITSDAPWLYSALTQVRDVEQTGEHIPGFGDFRISEATATKVRMLLSNISLISLPSPEVSPVSGGGVSIVWSVGPREVKYDFCPNGPTMFFKIEDDEISSDQIIARMNSVEITEPLKWMLDSRP
jgi:hypothetical protein